MFHLPFRSLRSHLTAIYYPLRVTFACPRRRSAPRLVHPLDKCCTTAVTSTRRRCRERIRSPELVVGVCGIVEVGGASRGTVIVSKKRTDRQRDVDDLTEQWNSGRWRRTRTGASKHAIESCTAPTTGIFTSAAEFHF